eukprot:m.24727 g.24727  ORF g.24727 m.24727 type:complete len:442 (+) comp7636_c0_seq2:170-1495(+)
MNMLNFATSWQRMLQKCGRIRSGHTYLTSAGLQRKATLALQLHTGKFCVPIMLNNGRSIGVRGLHLLTLASLTRTMQAGKRSNSRSSYFHTESASCFNRAFPEDRDSNGSSEESFLLNSNGRRVVAIGDLHGDFKAAVKSLQIAGVIEEDIPDMMTKDIMHKERANISLSEEELDGLFNFDEIEWTGGDTILVQVGDILDRGGGEIRIMALLHSLRFKAREAGGDVQLLLGNHEIMNMEGQAWRYVSPEAKVEANLYRQFEGQTASETNEDDYNRDTMYLPGYPMNAWISKNKCILQVDDTLFVHAGVSSEFIKPFIGYDKMHAYDAANKIISLYLQGRNDEASSFVPPKKYVYFEDLYWTRIYGGPAVDCKDLKEVLKYTNARRMVVGHTPQRKGINTKCDDRIWRIDVGMSDGVMGGYPQILEILPPSSGNESSVSILS